MNAEISFKFSKEDKITGEKRIDNLFRNGDSFIAYPLRVLCLKNNRQATPTVSVLISIPKKRIKSAVKRNRMKRLIREAYRLNRHVLNDGLSEGSISADVGFVYVKDDLADYALIEKAMCKALLELKNRLKTNVKDV